MSVCRSSLRLEVLSSSIIILSNHSHSSLSKFALNLHLKFKEWNKVWPLKEPDLDNTHHEDSARRDEDAAVDDGAHDDRDAVEKAHLGLQLYRGVLPHLPLLRVHLLERHLVVIICLCGHSEGLVCVRYYHWILNVRMTRSDATRRKVYITSDVDL